METCEEWLPIVGYEGLYEVSNKGRVRSMDRVVTHTDGRVRSLKGKILSQFPHDKAFGYWSVSLSRDGHLRPVYIHVLVAEAFICPRPAGLVVRHGPLGKDFNTPENLCWGTQAENLQDITRQQGHHNALKTQCKRGGHEFTPENTYVIPSSGSRVCRKCKAEKDAQRHARKKGAALP